MANKYYLSSDKINGKEKSYLNRLAKFLESKGHTVKMGPVDPNGTQAFGIKTASKGWIGVHIQGGKALQTFSDLCNGVKKGYYHYDYAYCLGSYEFTHNTHLKSSIMEEKNTYVESDVTIMKKYTYNKTPNEINNYWKKYGQVYYQDTFQECMEKMVGGSTGDNTETSGGDSSSSYLDIIKELIQPWDGDVEIRTDNEHFYVNYIKNPNPTILVKEEVNIVNGSINVTDYNPQTPNVLNVTYGKNIITMRDNYLIKRFGENSVTIPAVEYVTNYSSKNDSKTSDEDMVSEDNTTTEQVSSTSTISSIPITDKNKAYDFAKKCWNKIKRNNGHVIECQIIGMNSIKQGMWVQVYIPSFNEDSIMYCTKINHSKDSSNEWLTNITLVDYTPSLSQVTIENKSDKKDESKETEETEEEV